MARTPERDAQYRRNLRQRAETTVGKECLWCGVMFELEFAHIYETPLSGAGRGRCSKKRYKDVISNPHCYARLCRPCHEGMDYHDNPTLDQVREKRAEGVPCPF